VPVSRRGENDRETSSLNAGLFQWVFQVDSRFLRFCALILSAIIAAVVYQIFNPSLLLFEERLGGLGWTLSADDKIEERITVVAIDEQSISEVGPWPWPRETIAKLVTEIDSAGAQLQLHDIVYADSKSGDRELSSALGSAAGVVIAQIPVLIENSSDPSLAQDIQTGVMTHPLTGINCQDSSLNLFNSSSYVGASKSFNSVAKGHITPLLNLDGSISSQPAVICVDGLPYPSLAIAGLLEAANLNGSDVGNFGAKVSSGRGILSSAQELTFDDYPGLSIPLDNKGSLRVSYRSGPESYRAISAVDVLNGSADLSLLRNSWVLVGATAFGLDDVVPTPYSAAAPGVELQARILASILDIDVPYTPASASWIFLALCAVYASFFLMLAGSSGRTASIGIPVMIVTLPILSLGFHALLLNVLTLWLGWIVPAVFASIFGSVLFAFEQARVRGQRNRVLANLKSYLPSDAAEEIAYSLPSSNISASRKDVTLLSADLRNFSAYSEARSAEESAAVLHFFFQRATQIIEKHQGHVHEFTGDGLLAIWDRSDTESAELAYRAGTSMIEQLNLQLLDAFAPAGLEPLAVGVGIEQGPALIGFIGPAHRRAHALLGDTVTIVMRIQELTADLAQPVLLGECVARQIASVRIQSQGSYLLAGLTNPHVLFAPVPENKDLGAEVSAPKLTLLFGGRK
jgi:CHASE2 domain-containing sensor protein